MKTGLASLFLPSLLFLSSTPVTNESYLLRPYAHKGDQWTCNSEFELDLALHNGSAEKKESGEEKKEEKDESKTVSYKFNRVDRFDSEVLETKEDLSSKVKREYNRSSTKTRTKIGKSEPSEKHEDTLFNQASLTLAREGEGIQLSSSVKIPDELKPLLDIELPSSIFLSSNRVEEGKDWSVDAKALAKFFQTQLWGKDRSLENAEGKIKAMLKSLAEEKGKKSAEISIEGTLTGNLNLAVDTTAEASNYPVSIQLKGTLSFDPTNSRATRFSIQGKIDPRDDKRSNPGFASGNLLFTQEVEDKAQLSGSALRLIARFHTGDTGSRTDKMKLEANVDEFVTKLDGKPIDIGSPEVEFKITSTTTYKDEILDASEGLVKKIRREFDTIKLDIAGPKDAKAENPMQELEGKAVIIEREGEETHTKLEGAGKVDAKLLKSITIGDDFKYLLPPDEVKTGSSWAPDEKKIADIFARALPKPEDEEEEGKGLDVKSLLKKLQGALECKLLSFSEEEGSAAARIRLKANFELDITQEDLPKEMVPSKGFEMSISLTGKLDGEFLFDYKTGKPIKLELSGPLRFKMNISQSADENGMDFEQLIKASGNLEMEQSFSKAPSSK